MSYTWYEVFWFFLLYSFAGWVIGTSGAALKEKKFIDVGFLFGPWCPSYGFGAVGFALFLPELKDQPVFLFAGGVILIYYHIFYRSDPGTYFPSEMERLFQTEI